jgi:hypothetical protein
VDIPYLSKFRRLNLPMIKPVPGARSSTILPIPCSTVTFDSLMLK